MPLSDRDREVFAKQILDCFTVPMGDETSRMLIPESNAKMLALCIENVIDVITLKVGAMAMTVDPARPGADKSVTIVKGSDGYSYQVVNGKAIRLPF